MNKNIYRQTLFTILFLTLAYIALQIPLTSILGANTKLTMFDALAPVAGGLFPLAAILVTLLGIQSINIALTGTSITVAIIIKLLTPLIAAFYFRKKHWLQIIIPIIAMIVFVTSPIGRTVWFYSLFWLIPIGCYLIKDRSLLARSLGATFSAHAVGGMLWVYFVPLPKAVWISLIPIVARERVTLSVGTALFFMALQSIQHAVTTPSRKLLTRGPLNDEIHSY